MRKYSLIILIISILILPTLIKALNIKPIGIDSVASIDGYNITYKDGIITSNNAINQFKLNFYLKNIKTDEGHIVVFKDGEDNLIQKINIANYSGDYSNFLEIYLLELEKQYLNFEVYSADCNKNIDEYNYVYYTCTEKDLLYEENITINLPIYKDLNFNNSNVYITNIYNGEEEITPLLKTNDYGFNYHSYEFNQDVKIKLQGQDLRNDINYKVKIGEYSNLYLGSELTEGVLLTIPYSYINKIITYGLDTSFKVDSLSKSIVYNKDGINSFKFSNTNTSNENIDFSLSYGNNKQIQITNNGYIEAYQIEEKQYNDLLKLNIKGNNFSDRIYEVKVELVDYICVNEICHSMDTKQIKLSETFEINGLDLNNEKTIEIKNINFASTLDNHTNRHTYYYYVTINNKTFISMPIIYKIKGNLNYRLFYENGKEFFYVNNGGGYKCVDDSVLVYFYGYDFVDNSKYEYELYDSYSMDLLYKGTISGKNLKYKGISLKKPKNIDFLNLIIKNKGQLVTDTIVSFESITSATGTLITADVVVDGKKIYSGENRSYEVPINKNGYIKFTGFGYDDEIVHSIKIRLLDKEYKPLSLIGEYNLSGKDLNEGKLIIDIKEINETGEIYYDIIFDEKESLMISINGINPNDYISNNNSYKINSNSYIIDKIKNNTTMKQLIQEIITGINNVIVISKGEILENTDKVGTGMFIRVLDEYNNQMFEYESVVTGDITGDGEITESDLTFVKEHLAELNSLTGVYEKAANQNDDDIVSITDLVKLNKDIKNKKHTD